ncbi:Thioredoxin reductase-like selenoprotein T CG3887 [Clonorchis sinensis]|uniref:SelT-like protein n=2 Tax=Clonorchis sinensis TaxID=79923 RepID=G7YPN0_CLOSI|nr:Thioredoxin reductase-like selenoprotein T CG3887 [Clonorchis sinensis]GAA54911.1 selT-like protein [Clonorchis sinensis]
MMKSSLMWAIAFAVCVIFTLRDFTGMNGESLQQKEIPKLKTQSLLPTLRFVYCSLGFATPSFLTYAFQNKVSFCLTAFLIGNLIEGQLLSTGAFEIYYNDMPIWSKLDSNRIPQPHELLDILNNQMKFKPTFGHGSTPQAIPPS